MAAIILARHGETEWNVAEIFRGRADIELNATGVKQAEFLARYLREAEIDTVYSSPLKRALQTAEAVAKHHRLEVTIAPGLVDFDFGEWQGLSQREVAVKYAVLYSRWLNSPDKVEMPGGESLEDVRQRALGVVEEVVARHEGTVVLVSHRVVNKVIICALLGIDDSRFWDIRLDTCGITTFAHENGRFILTRHNDTSFLRSLSPSAPADF